MHSLYRIDTIKETLVMTTSTSVEHDQLETPIDPTINSEPGPTRIHKKLTGLAAEKQKARIKAYQQTEKRKLAKKRAAAKQRHHNTLRKAARMSAKYVEEARIMGRSASHIAELEVRSNEAQQQLTALEAEKAAAKEARRVGDPERKRLQYERQKILKREYARRKQAEKKSQEADGNGSGSGQVGGNEYEQDEMEEKEEVMMRED
jgi:hypothetical protein